MTSCDQCRHCVANPGGYGWVCMAKATLLPVGGIRDCLDGLDEMSESEKVRAAARQIYESPLGGPLKMLEEARDTLDKIASGEIPTRKNVERSIASVTSTKIEQTILHIWREMPR